MFLPQYVKTELINILNSTKQYLRERVILAMLFSFEKKKFVLIIEGILFTTLPLSKTKDMAVSSHNIL